VPVQTDFSGAPMRAHPFQKTRGAFSTLSFGSNQRHHRRRTAGSCLSVLQTLKFMPDFFHQPLRDDSKGFRQPKHRIQSGRHQTFLQPGDVAVVQATVATQLDLRPLLPQSSLGKHVSKGSPDLVNFVQSGNSRAPISDVPLRIIQGEISNALTSSPPNS
jgi:hypothetical protein